MHASGKSFKELRVGQKFLFSPVTMTEAQVVNFAGLSGDFNPNQMNDEYARNTIFRQRIAHGLLTASLMSGPLGMLLSGTAIALLEASFRFTHPVKFGDTISREARVVELTSSRKHEGGRVRFQVTCRSRRSPVLVGEFTFLVGNKKSNIS
jgi:acyl dehydratase